MTEPPVAEQIPYPPVHAEGDATGMTKAQRRKALTAVLASLTSVGLTFGTSIPLMSMLLDRQGIATSVIGFNSAMPILATILCAPMLPWIIRKIGLKKALFGGLALIIACFLIMGFVRDLEAWFLLRFLVGMGMSIHWVISETWLNAASSEKRRGFYSGLYATLMSAGFALGPAMLTVIDLDSLTPFLLISTTIFLAGVPLWWARDSMPRIEVEQGHSHWKSLKTAPTIFLAVLTAGVVDASLLSLLSVYGVRVGLPEAEALILLTIMGGGTVVLQLPLGMLADKINRRGLLLFSGLAGLAGAILLPLTVGNNLLLWPILFLWGGFVVGLYTMALAELGKRFRGAALAGANGLFVTAYCIGSLAGPPVAGSAMDIWGPIGLPVTMATACGLFCLIGIVRTVFRIRKGKTA